jgi:hypothetical protein
MKRLCVLLLAVSIFSLDQAALAYCNAPQPRLVCAEYSASEVVLEATLIRIEPVLDNNDPDAINGYFYTLTAGRMLRGSMAPNFRVYEGNDSGRATFSWKIGTTYVLFLFKSYEKGAANAWSLDGCGNSGPVSKSASVLRKIGRINPASSVGTISGVVSAFALSDGLPGVQLAVRSTSHTYKAVTDSHGRFQVDVPPGRYSIRALSPSVVLTPSDITYEDPNNLNIQPGGCAQVQLTRPYSPH